MPFLINSCLILLDYFLFKLSGEIIPFNNCYLLINCPSKILIKYIINLYVKIQKCDLLIDIVPMMGNNINCL